MLESSQSPKPPRPNRTGLRKQSATDLAQTADTRPQPTTARQLLGRYGEDRACDYLRGLGYSIVERNWRCRIGEIDIIARDHDRFVFVEVKTRSADGFGHPFESITETKAARLRRLVAAWCESRQVSGIKVRLDAVSVLVRAGRVNIEHLKQVL